MRIFGYIPWDKSVRSLRMRRLGLSLGGFYKVLGVFGYGWKNGSERKTKRR